MESTRIADRSEMLPEGSEVIARLRCLVVAQAAGRPELPSCRVVDPQEFASRLLSPVSDWLGSMDRARATREAYQRGIEAFLSWLTAEAKEQSLSAIVPGFKDYLSGRYASRTVALYISSVRIFFKWAGRTYGIPNIAADVKVKRVRGFKRESLTREQARRLVAEAEGDTLKARRDHAILRLLITTGLRRSEVLGANVGDMRSKDGSPVLFVKGKGHVEKDEFAVLEPGTYRVVQEWLSIRGRTLGRYGDEDPLFVSLAWHNRRDRLGPMGITRMVKARLAAIGLTGSLYTVHSLRHTAGTLLYQATGDMRRAQVLLRHQSPNTTSNYVHTVNRIGNAPERILGQVLDAIEVETCQQARACSLAASPTGSRQEVCEVC